MSKTTKEIFWVAGENSGDLHSSMILKKLKERGREYRHFGIGGHRMQAEGFTSLYPFSKFSLMGFWEVLQSLPFIWRVEKEIKKIIDRKKPDLIVLVDYPGFNMRLAKTACERSIPVLYFICPQFWAWKHGRVKKLHEYTDFVASILPFEKELLDIHRVNSSYVGHPIAEEITIEADREQFFRTFGLDPAKKWLGFVPGSRDTEVRKMLPEFIKTIELFKDSDYEFLISKSHTVCNELFTNLIPDRLSNRITVIDGYIYEMMKYSHFMVITSGTATLEAAYTGTPFIIVYKASRISFCIAKRLVRINRIGLPNIILDSDVVPELIQEQVTGKNIFDQMQSFLRDSVKYEEMISRLSTIKDVLSKKSASSEMATIIENMVEGNLPGE